MVANNSGSHQREPQALPGLFCYQKQIAVDGIISYHF
jgi:hypothetical protein